MNVITNFQLTLTIDDILCGQGLDPEYVRQHKHPLLAAAKRACSRGFNLLHPVALTREVEVNSSYHDRILVNGGASLTGPAVIHHLGGAKRVVAAICTIGRELEETVSQLFTGDPQLALALDGLGNAAVEMLTQQVCVQAAEKAQAEEGWTASTPLSPGILDWPVETGQPQIFALLDPSAAGISLTSGGMMLPKKSASFIIGLGPDMSQVDMCEVCNLRKTCRYHHV